MNVFHINRSHPLRSGLAAYALCLVLPVVAGCGSRAHSDLYQQRMASEIRVLEDQLYDADYQNRVLQEKLDRYDEKVKSSRIPTPNSDITNSIDPNLPPTGGYATDQDHGPSGAIPMPMVDPNTHSPIEAIFPERSIGASPNSELLELPSFDMGEPIDPNSSPIELNGGSSILDFPQDDSIQELPAPLQNDSSLNEESPSGRTQPPPPSEAKPRAVDAPAPLTDPGSPSPFNREKRNEPPVRRPQVEFLPPPSTPTPPGSREIKPSPIIPGKASPPAREGDRENPPGQINLPDDFQSSLRVPEAIKLHKTLSQGHHDGPRLDGATLIVNAVDSLGKRVDLNQFDIDAVLSVVVLDPERSPSEAKLGRWDFDAKQVAAMISSDVGKGLEIPIRFNEMTPTTDKVIVHVRLRGEEDEMRCNDRLDLRERTAATAWTPRGDQR